jgi:hypothetical protein
MTTKVVTDKYADAINCEHEQARLCASNAIEAAMRCGELLIAQKKRVRHGEFQAWVKEHCAFSHDTANVYMRITRQKTSGLVFSSLAHMLTYERERKGSGEDRRQKFLRSALSTHDMISPDDQEQTAEDWAYTDQAKRLFNRIAECTKDCDPDRVYRGARECDRKVLRKLVLTNWRFFTEMKAALGLGLFTPAEVARMSANERKHEVSAEDQELEMA